MPDELTNSRGKGSSRRLTLTAGGIVLAIGILVAAYFGPAWWASRSERPGPSQLSPEPKDWPPGLPKPFVNSIGMRFARIPAGKFMRGSPDTEGRDDERPRREVEISKAFGLGIYEVTQAEYRRVMDASPGAYEGDFLPVERVFYKDAEEFCRRLSALEEEEKAGRVYRLPTEAEWEYACRGGAASFERYSFGDTISTAQANFFDGKRVGTTTDVGSYPPNAWGLYDMHGNVWEFCADWYDAKYYADGPSNDPRNAVEDAGRIPSRVRRGGSFYDSSFFCRSATRGEWQPDGCRFFIGFRVCFTWPD
jgi:formylglycine-generating enzyme required for sulfatase activity